MSNEPGSDKSTSRNKWTRTNNIECKVHWLPWGNAKVLHDDMPDRRRSYALMPSSHGHVNCICSRSVLRASLQGLATNGSYAARRLLNISSNNHCSRNALPHLTLTNTYPSRFITYDDNRAVFNDKLTSRNIWMRNLHEWCSFCKGRFPPQIPDKRLLKPNNISFLLWENSSS